MPFRIYICHTCEKQTEIYQGIKEDILTTCECGGLLYQDLSGITASFQCSPKTLGQLADMNSKKLGHSGVLAKDRAAKEADNQMLRERAAKLSEKTGREFIAPCDRKRPTIDGKELKPLDKDLKKKIFSGDKKEVARKAKKYINEGKL